MKILSRHYAIGIFFLVCFLILMQRAIRSNHSTSNTASFNHDATKKQQWNAMAQEVASWTDALGKGIDPEIKDTVIVLNLLGFKTTQSCEGHIGLGEGAYPWIDFSIEDEKIDALRKKYANLFQREAERVAEIEKNYPGIASMDALKQEDRQELKDLRQQRITLSNEISKLFTLKIVPVNDLIKEFYKDRSIDLDRALAFNMGHTLSSLGGQFQITRNDAEKLKKLKEYQEEMKAFTVFLTHYYFNN